MTHIDTAEMYDTAEEVVAEATAGRRDEVFLVSKVLPQNASRTGTITACDRSLARLRTDRLDCYLLHWPGAHPIADIEVAHSPEPDLPVALKPLEGRNGVLEWARPNR